MGVIHIGDMVLIDDNIVFQVMEEIEYNGENYVYGYKMPDDIVDAIDPADYKKAFLKEIVEEETEECFLEEVEDKELIKALKSEIIKENHLDIPKEG